MEVGVTWLSSPTTFPSRTHLKNCLPSSVLMFQEQAIHSVNFDPTSSIARKFPIWVLLQELRNKCRTLLNTFKEDGNSQETLDKKQMEMVSSFYEEDSDESDRFAQKFESQLFDWPVFWNIVPPSKTQENGSLCMTVQSSNASKLSNVEPAIIDNLAKEALLASKAATLITKNSTDLDLVSSGSSSNSVFDEENIVVRSTRRLKRQSKTRRVPKINDKFPEPQNLKRVDGWRKTSEGYDSNDPLRLFLWGPETVQLLSPDEESKLIDQVQDLMKLEGVKCKLQPLFGRELTMVEWAHGAGLSCPVLKEKVHSGNRSREKLISANLRMVVHIAKQYQTHGLSLEDLLQAGSMGLMKSVERFKPNSGCRFPSYAYWWIRQSVQKAIYLNSRTIRLPDHVHYQLNQIKEAKRSCVREGNSNPTTEELARRTGISVHKLERLLLWARKPISMQTPIWKDQGSTFQDIIVDDEIDIPEVSVAKQMMRQHVRGLLTTLKPRERQIINLRFGIEDGKPKSLSEIGGIFGLSKQCIWQSEVRAMGKLRRCLDSHGLEAYADLLV
nr:plastidic RNA polymerase sigma-subunit 6 [Passiflora oerstedii]